MSIIDRFRLTGKKAIVTGAAQGIGHHVAIALAEAGADVALFDLNEATETQAAIRALGRDAPTWTAGAPLPGVAPCTQPYSASVFNISAMSFGALSANAILALNQGAKIGGFAHDTGEGSTRLVADATSMATMSPGFAYEERSA